jgi:hypothetical protein
MKESHGRWVMNGSVLIMIVAGFVVAAITGCTAQIALALGTRDDENQITSQKGRILTVKLERDPTTGYTRETLEPEGAMLRQLGEPGFRADSELLGALVTVTLSFDAQVARSPSA